MTLRLFSAHPKCHKKLGEALQNAQPESNVVKLKFLCRARWIERIDALDRVKNFTLRLLFALRTFILKVLVRGLLTLLQMCSCDY